MVKEKFISWLLGLLTERGYIILYRADYNSMLTRIRDIEIVNGELEQRLDSLDRKKANTETAALINEWLNGGGQ